MAETKPPENSKSTVVLAQQISCPKCGIELPLGVFVCSDCLESKRSSLDKSVPVVLVILVFCSSLLMLSSSYNIVKMVAVSETASRLETAKPPPKEDKVTKDINLAAYEAALKFLGQRYANIQRFSDFNQSPIDRDGNKFTALIYFDTLNTSGSSVRNVCTVEMVHEQGDWKLAKIQ